MEHFELLELVENSIGTKLFEAKKKSALETLKKKKLVFIDEIVNKNIRTVLENSKIFLLDLKKSKYYRYIKNKIILFNKFSKSLENSIGISKVKKEKIKFSGFILKKSVENIDYLRLKIPLVWKEKSKKDFSLINSKKIITIKFKKIRKKIEFFLFLEKFKKTTDTIYHVCINENGKIERI